MLNKAVIATVLLTVGAAAFADGTPGLDKREANQQARIEQGVASGELTRPETRRLEQGERSLNRQEAAAKSDGVVTRKERAHLQNKADHLSHRIHRQKHDAQVRP